MYFETHAHYDDARFDEDRDALLASLPGAGICRVVIPGCNVASSRAALALAEKYPHVYAAVGIHPEDAAGFTPGAAAEIRALLAHPKAVAVGEVGLDYYWEENPAPELQKACLEAMLTLSEESGKPVIFHERKACADAMEAVRRHPGIRGVFHCFSGSAETAAELVKLGWYISFTGVITFKNARRVPQVAAGIPDDRIMIETDSPYMAPEPHRGERNSSLFLPEIAEAVGRARGISREAAAELTCRNAMRFFGLEDG